MVDFMIFLVLFLIIAAFFYKTLKSYLTQSYIRKKIKREIWTNKEYLQQSKHDKERTLGVYTRIYNLVTYKPHKFFSKDRLKYERLVNRELNWMIKNPFTKLFRRGILFFKGIFVLFFALFAALFGSIAVDEYKTSNLKLPTVDPNVDLAVNFDLVNGFTNLFSVFSPINDLESYDFSSLTNDGLVPYYPTVSYPSAVTNTEQLGQAIASNMSNFENQFTIYFEGNTNNLNDTIEQSYQWVEQNEPYLWAVLGGLSGTSTSYDNYAELEFTLNYDLTAEQNGLVFAKVKQLAAAVPDDLSDADKVKFVNDYIVKHTKYNSDSAANAHTPYAILLTGEGVCEGYALAAYLILKEIGMDVQYVVGDAGGPHAWNMVKVDGHWYHLDTTWNDPIPDQGSKVRYDYFLVSDKTLSKDHAWDSDLYPTTAEDDYL